MARLEIEFNATVEREGNTLFSIASLGAGRIRIIDHRAKPCDMLSPENADRPDEEGLWFLDSEEARRLSEAIQAVCFERDRFRNAECSIPDIKRAMAALKEGA